jgi:hypothetical protein
LEFELTARRGVFQGLDLRRVALTFRAQLLVALPPQLLSDRAFQLGLLFLGLRAQGFHLFAILGLEFTVLPLERLDLGRVIPPKLFDLGAVALFELPVAVSELLFPLLGRAFEFLDSSLWRASRAPAPCETLPLERDLAVRLGCRDLGALELFQLLPQRRHLRDVLVAQA